MRRGLGCVGPARIHTHQRNPEVTDPQDQPERHRLIPHLREHEPGAVVPLLQPGTVEPRCSGDIKRGREVQGVAARMRRPFVRAPHGRHRRWVLWHRQASLRQAMGGGDLPRSHASGTSPRGSAPQVMCAVNQRTRGYREPGERTRALSIAKRVPNRRVNGELPRREKTDSATGGRSDRHANRGAADFVVCRFVVDIARADTHCDMWPPGAARTADVVARFGVHEALEVSVLIAGRRDPRSRGERLHTQSLTHAIAKRKHESVPRRGVAGGVQGGDPVRTDAQPNHRGAVLCTSGRGHHEQGEGRGDDKADESEHGLILETRVDGH